jgi:glutathione S-transferase
VRAGVNRVTARDGLDRRRSCRLMWRLTRITSAGEAMRYTYTAAATLLALLLYMAVSMVVGQARVKYRIKAPAVTGDEHFERAYRVQMNTVEQMAFFLPALWLCAALLSDKGAAAGGLIWVIGRGDYAVSYLSQPEKRGPGMAISMLAQIGLFLGAVYGLMLAAIG